MEGGSKKKIETKERSNENSSEMQEMCSTCEGLRKENDLLSRKCEDYERHVEFLGIINAQNANSSRQSQQENARLKLIVAHLMQQNMLKLENDADKQGKANENNSQLSGNSLPDINKFLEIKMNIPKEQDVEDSDDGHDAQVFEEAEDEETEASLDEEQQTCTWIVHDVKGTPRVCEEVFPAFGDLTFHFHQDHANVEWPGYYICWWYRCKRYGKPFKNKKDLINHFRTHSGRKALAVPFRRVRPDVRGPQHPPPAPQHALEDHARVPVLRVPRSVQQQAVDGGSL